MPADLLVKEMRIAAAVMRAGDYGIPADECAKARFMRRVAVSEQERAEHAGRDAFDHILGLRSRF